MVDLDGTATFSQVETVFLGDVDPQAAPEELVQARVFPNPTTGNFNIGLQSKATDDLAVRYQLFNATGQLMASQALTASPGFSKHGVDIQHLSRGIYYVRLSIPLSNGTVKVVTRRVMKL
jgi:hypothetical protein